MSNDNKIIDRILKRYNISGFEAMVKEMPLSDLQSLLIEIYNQRAKAITAKELLEQYKKNRFVQHSKLSSNCFLEFDQLAYQLLPKDFQILELSPVCPLGSISVMTPNSQNTVLTTIRNTEVCSDATNIMALEASLQRKKFLLNKDAKTNPVKLCASHRLLRTQFFDNPLFLPHFKILSLCIAGKDGGNFQFELSALRELIIYYYDLISKYITEKISKKISVKCIVFFHNEYLNERINNLALELRDGHNIEVISKINTDENWNYYHQIRFNIFISDRSTGEDFFIGDGGDTTWISQLLSDKKERFMISGLGCELFIQKIIDLSMQEKKHDR